MKKCNIIAVVISCLIILLVMVLARTKIITKETSNNKELIENNSLNQLENIESDVLNAIEEIQKVNEIEEKIDNNVVENKEIINTKQQEDTIKEINKEKITTEPKVTTTTSNDNNISNKKQETTTNKPKEESKEENKKENSEIKNETQNDTQKETQTEVGNPSLAYATYRVVNTSVLPEIKTILENEIRKDQVSVDFGTKVVYGSKSQCYNNTTGFTYMLIADPTKGKVEGNYTKFPERVKNTVGALENYYIYAEDEYAYNGQGLNPKLAQTLVWIYVSFN